MAAGPRQMATPLDPRRQGQGQTPAPTRQPSSTGGPAPRGTSSPPMSRGTGFGEGSGTAATQDARSDTITTTSGQTVKPGAGAAGRRSGPASPPPYARPGTPVAESSYKIAPALRTEEFFLIRFTHLPTGNKVAFEGWVTDFSDNFSSTWNPQTVYGRMDPLATFQGTQRSISIGFAVVSDDITMAMGNLARVNRLIQFLYPVYEKAGNPKTAGPDQTILKSGPLIGLKYTNLISSVDPPGGYLVGYLDGVSYNPDMGAGGFLPGTVKTSDKEIEPVEEQDSNERFVERDTTVSKAYVPKQLNISLNFTVMHTHMTGWIREGEDYVFGNDTMNGKYPNAQFISYTSTGEVVKQVLATEDPDAADPDAPREVLQEQRMSPGSELEEANQSEVLGSIGG